MFALTQTWLEVCAGCQQQPRLRVGIAGGHACLPTSCSHHHLSQAPAGMQSQPDGWVPASCHARPSPAAVQGRGGCALVEAGDHAPLGVGQVAWVARRDLGLRQRRVPQHKAPGAVWGAVHFDAVHLGQACATALPWQPPMLRRQREVDSARHRPVLAAQQRADRGGSIWPVSAPQLAVARKACTTPTGGKRHAGWPSCYPLATRGRQPLHRQPGAGQLNDALSKPAHQ